MQKNTLLCKLYMKMNICTFTISMSVSRCSNHYVLLQCSKNIPSNSTLLNSRWPHDRTV